MEFIESLVETDPNPSKLATPSKELMCKWIKSGLDYFEDNQPMVKKSFLVCGITNALDGSENHFVHCSKELPDLQVPYVDEYTDDPFVSGGEESDDDYDTDESNDDLYDTDA